MAKTISVREQYLDIKSQYADCILLFRLGDFYEMFDEDAEIAARELDLTLTGRSWQKDRGERSPMAGVPYHAAEGYIAKLVERGYHVAVCDQISEPNGRGPVDRAVTRVITPGTVIEPALLAENRANYLLAFVPIGSVDSGEWTTAGIAYADASTGEFQVTQLTGDNAPTQVLEELARIAPREVLMPQAWVERGVSLPNGMHLTPIADWQVEQKNAEQVLLSHFRVRTLESFGVHDKPGAVAAAGAVIQYLRKTQRDGIAQIGTLKLYSTEQFMVLDQFTRRNLELTETIRGRSSRGSLINVLDRTVTAMGARLLHSWINQPLLDISLLNSRLNVVEGLTSDEVLRAEIQSLLKNVSDIERLANRLLIAKANARDLLGLRDSLLAVPQLARLLQDNPALKKLAANLDPCEDVRDLVNAAINDDAPANFNNIGVIRPGYAQELDDILAASQHARDWIAALEATERRRTGIASIKVGFNQVFGYYIEVTHANA
ncbi:MAG TPA: DNA mismatch repair protein MutS, partial [Aggregatilineales bacterium]|nr:DNA mismatch repair protein MutS [Aggregatilineales bacterium]